MPESPEPITRGPATVRGALYVMRGVLTQISGLAGILAFLVEMWNQATLETSIYAGIVVGGGVYLVLLLVDFGLEQLVIAAQNNPQRASNEEHDEKEEVPAQAANPSDESDSSGPEAGSTEPRTPDSDSSSPDTSSATQSSPGPEELAAV